MGMINRQQHPCAAAQLAHWGRSNGGGRGQSSPTSRRGRLTAPTAV
ncbi:MAG TPA: hypothetical protein VFA09_17770 [Ktedonobacteraceae bacterium]|nr:hypothetical protein [Ktedonobacteraceae bacterium]